MAARCNNCGGYVYETENGWECPDCELVKTKNKLKEAKEDIEFWRTAFNIAMNRTKQWCDCASELSDELDDKEHEIYHLKRELRLIREYLNWSEDD